MMAPCLCRNRLTSAYSGLVSPMGMSPLGSRGLARIMGDDDQLDISPFDHVERLESAPSLDSNRLILVCEAP